MRRRGRGIHSGLARGPKPIQLLERALQRRAMTSTGDHRLDVAQCQQAAERHFRELTSELGQTFPRHH